jgi:glycosyltransferase involved in cell wall biosynthesis
MSLGHMTVSIVIPCFNDGRYLSEAIESAEACPSDQCEIIVVNDGSTDSGTLEVLSGIEQRGHRVLHQRNRGLAAARNYGISSARGGYILPLDADNRVRATYVERGMEIFEREPGVDVVYGDAEYFGAWTGRNRVPEFNLGRLLAWNYIDACAVYRKSAWERCGGYDENMPTQGFEDWDLWCRIALSGGGFRHVDEVLFDYRVRSDSMSSTMATPERVAAIRQHMHARKFQATQGQFLAAYQSWDFAVDQLRSRPMKSLVGLLLRAYFPSLHSRLTTRVNAKQPTSNSSSS